MYILYFHQTTNSSLYYIYPPRDIFNKVTISISNYDIMLWIAMNELYYHFLPPKSVRPACLQVIAHCST